MSAPFLAASAMLTGFDEAELLGTGLVDRYLRELTDTAGNAAADRFLSACAAALDSHAGHPDRQEAAFAADILASPVFGPLARNVITMWYLGTWLRLPDAWYAGRARPASDIDHVVEPGAYVESLVWRAAGTHPPGARQPGFGSWSFAPVVKGAAE